MVNVKHLCLVLGLVSKALLILTSLEPNDPTGFYCEKINVSNTLAHIEKLNSENQGDKYTLNQILGLSAAKALK